MVPFQEKRGLRLEMHSKAEPVWTKKGEIILWRRNEAHAAMQMPVDYGSLDGCMHFSLVSKLGKEKEDPEAIVDFVPAKYVREGGFNPQMLEPHTMASSAKRTGVGCSC